LTLNFSGIRAALRQAFFKTSYALFAATQHSCLICSSLAILSHYSKINGCPDKPGGKSKQTTGNKTNSDFITKRKQHSSKLKPFFGERLQQSPH